MKLCVSKMVDVAVTLPKVRKSIVNEQNMKQKKPIHLAAERGHGSVVRVLLQVFCQLPFFFWGTH